MSSLSFLSHFDRIAKGVLDLSGIVFYVSLIAFALFANRIFVATSDGPVLTNSTVWTEYFIQVSGVFADYPTFGVDATQLGVRAGGGADQTAMLQAAIDKAAGAREGT